VLSVLVHAWLSNDESSLAPGDSVRLALTVHNLSDETASFTIVPAGLTASWTTIGRGNITLFGGSQETIDVTVTPPALPSTTSGPTAVAVRIIPLGDTDDAVVAEATIGIESFDDVRIVPLQPIQRARRRATFEFMVENHGNAVASCRLHLVDVSGRVDGDFDPPAVGLAPGSSSLVRLKARARREMFRRATRTLDFEVEVARQDLAPVAAPLSLVQPPTIARGAIVRVAGLLALAGLAVAGWFFVAEPAIDAAASDRVDERIEELGADDPEPIGEATTSDGETDDGSTDSTVPADDVVPTFFRLAVDAPLTQTADQTITMAATDVFDMTDVRIENPFNDRGIATLLVNGDPVFVWALENVRGTYFEPRITPIRLTPGDNVTFSVRCDEIGNSSRSTCTNAINIGGESRPVGSI